MCDNLWKKEWFDAIVNTLKPRQNGRYFAYNIF